MKKIIITTTTILVATALLPLTSVSADMGEVPVTENCSYGAYGSTTCEPTCYSGPYGINVCDDTGIILTEEGEVQDYVIYTSAATALVGLAVLINTKLLNNKFQD